MDFKDNFFKSAELQTKRNRMRPTDSDEDYYSTLQTDAEKTRELVAAIKKRDSLTDEEIDMQFEIGKLKQDKLAAEKHEAYILRNYNKWKLDELKREEESMKAQKALNNRANYSKWWNTTLSEKELRQKMKEHRVKQDAINAAAMKDNSPNATLKEKLRNSIDSIRKSKAATQSANLNDRSDRAAYEQWWKDNTKFNFKTFMGQIPGMASDKLDKAGAAASGAGFNRVGGLLTKSSKLLKALTTPLGVVVTGFTAIAAIIKAGYDAGQKAIKATTEVADSLKLADKSLNEFQQNVVKVNTAVKNREAETKTAEQIIESVKAKYAESYTGWFKNAVADLKKAIGETLAEESLSSILFKNYQAETRQNLLHAGYDNAQLDTISDGAVAFAWKNASQYSKNQGLDKEAVFLTEEFQNELKRITSILQSGGDSTIFQGFLADYMGDSYIPDVTRSKEVTAKYASEMMAQLSTMGLADQQNKLSEWENAGTVLQKIGKNLYSFDEVISQDAIEVNDKKASEILGEIVTNLKDKDNILKDMGANLDNIAGGHGGTGPSDAVKDAIHSSLEENQETIGKLQAGEGRHRITGNFMEGWTAGQADGTYRSGQLYSDSSYVYELQKHTDAAGKVLESEWKTLGTLDQWIAKMSGNFSSRYEPLRISYTGEGVTAGDQAALAARVASIYEIGNRSHGLATTLTSDKNNDAFNIKTDGSSNASDGGGHGFAIGGVGTVPVHNATLFEKGAEAVIPLESQAGIQYLSNALQQAGLSGGPNIQVTVELSGINVADNDRQWNEVARNIGERINTIVRREGSV